MSNSSRDYCINVPNAEPGSSAINIQPTPYVVESIGDASHVQSTKDDVSVVNAFDQFGSQGFDVASSSAAQCWVGLTSAYLPHDSIVTILTQSTSGIGDR